MDSINCRLKNELNLEMIQNDTWYAVAELVGVENMLKVLEIIGGSTIYAPKVDTILRPVRDEKIKEEFNGYNFEQLARKYNLSIRCIRDLCLAQ